MFSIIMASSDSVWDVEPNISQNDSFPLSRFLEYTDPTLAEAFKPISAASLAFLEKLPTLFMSELSFDQEGNDVFRIRRGRVTNLSVVSGEIHYTFTIENNYGSVQIEDREAFRKALRMNSFELHRTHWAIKSANFADALTSAIPQAVTVGQATAHEPPLPDLTEVETICKLEDYVEYVLNIHMEPEQDVFYRGHPSYRFSLAPSLFRTNKSGAYTHLQKEEIMVREILSVQDSQFSNDRSMLDRLVRMQHFGLPTRLLDISSNPLVALYFACSQSIKDDDNNELDGEVIIIRTPRSDVLHFDSDRVSCIANLSLMRDDEKNSMDLKLAKDMFNQQASVIKLLHFIKREKPYFEGRIDPSDLERIFVVRARHTHERMIAQSGAFLLFGKDAIMPETGYGELRISRVRISSKSAILDQLDKLNIKASTIYPGIEKAASDIAKKHEVA